jgi:hypothetical protein
MAIDAGIIFWVLIGTSGILFVFGLARKSPKSFLWSGITIILPALYFFGAENAARLLGIVPIIPFVIAYFMAKKNKRIIE